MYEQCQRCVIVLDMACFEAKVGGWIFSHEAFIGQHCARAISTSQSSLRQPATCLITTFLIPFHTLNTYQTMVRACLRGHLVFETLLLIHMRLVHIGENGQLSLVRFDDHKAPCYAILSHTWGQENEEISFKDMTDNSGQEKSGYIKLSFMINQARKDGLRYFWIDTCCINQDSSAELSEAITSMFRWYQESTHCYVYLSDVLIRKRKADHDEVDSSWELAFRDSRWFKRGWTLQELIAPRSVKFFSKEKEFLGSKATLEKQIHEITRVPIAALQKASLSQFSIEERLSWAKSRQTKRAEDKAYSLLGLIGTSMAAIYGEGEEKAFKRLLKEAEGAQNTIFTTLDQSQRQMLMESIFFAQIDSRHMTIKGAHAKTCRWLLKSPQYIDWINPASVPEHLGFLWIRGKPGAGKSTLMKFAFTHVRKKTTNSICIAYFFNARGD